MSTETFPKEIPGLEHEFEIDVIGNITKKQYAGKFKFKIPNIRKQSQISVMEAQLNSGVVDQIDPSMAMTHYMLAYLNFTLEESPKWWSEDSKKGFELWDPNVISTIYNECSKYEREWQKTTFGDSRPEQEE